MSYRDIIPYGLYTDDKDNMRHSIDKLIITYEAISESFSFDDFCKEFSSISSFVFCENRGEDGYNSYFHKMPSSHYSWFTSGFWFEHCNVKFGFFVYRATEKLWFCCPRIRIEFNPNKIFTDDKLTVLFLLVRKYFKSGMIIECDYAVDVPCKTSQIISQSRKDKVIYNDSRYYGKRHTNGRLKIYNKKREVHDKLKVDIEVELTRCEVTFVVNKELQFDGAFMCSGNSNCKLSSNLRSIADLIALACTYGEDIEELLMRFVPDKRNRDMLIPVLYGEKHMIFNYVIFYDLIERYSKMYNCNHTFRIVGDTVD